ncbi:amino acid ABC transporter permease [Trinickia dinghuensis]|uniref:Glutamate/aspartate import permease protein GltK n=1 Tax=Trinickia dinghuensis TaxID=2291023 RepID=A0A3D8JX01_9BURK|nr:amino acid ABC transporter permease [Trinickia dinghuensis]RDU97400.1 amino acid ABC transporter permease [Trinickia dinghuensis]
MYHWDFGSVWVYHKLLLSGLAYTLVYTVIVVAAGLLLGMIVGIGRVRGPAVIAGLFRCYVEVFRCTPVLVQLIWFYYALPILTGIEMSPAMAAALSLTLYGGAFYAEIVRAGILAVDWGQTEAGMALGMRRKQIMRRVILPQAFRRMVPPLMSQSIMQLKNTSLLSVIAVPDLLYQAQSAAHDSYRPLELYTIAAVCYFIVLFPATVWSKRLESRLAKQDRN